MPIPTFIVPSLLLTLFAFSSDGNDALLPPLNLCKMVFSKEDKVLAKRWYELKGATRKPG